MEGNGAVVPVRWVAQAVSNLLCALKPSSYMQPANVIKIQLPMSSFADSSSVGGKNRVYFSPGAGFGVIDIFLLGILPSNSSPAGAAPRGNECVLNGEVGQSGSALCKAWFLCCFFFFIILMCMVKGLGGRQASQEVLSGTPRAVLKSLAKCLTCKCFCLRMELRFAFRSELFFVQIHRG